MAINIATDAIIVNIPADKAAPSACPFWRFAPVISALLILRLKDENTIKNTATAARPGITGAYMPYLISFTERVIRINTPINIRRDGARLE